MNTSLNGAEMFVTNGERGHVFAILATTNPMAQPQHRGTSAFIVEKGLPGFRVGRKIKKLGYRGLDTCELIFEDCRVPKDRLIGREGEGFKYVLTALKIGRIDVAARGIGMARAAFGDSIRYVQQRVQFGQPNGFTEDFAVERYSRDAKLLTVGEGTNRIQCLVGRKDDGLRRFRDRRFPVESSFPGHSANLDPHHVQRFQVRNHGE
jgi:alkylation response protein AidB-like acyl-CoA dehydrogenase